MLHTGALRQPRIMAAEAPKKHGGKVLADAYRAAPEIHLRMASLLELIADHGVTKVRTETAENLSQHASMISLMLCSAGGGAAKG
eukprot:COSAG01_NODE_28922_length_649_cov_1.941818_1_plen_85_part_00